jgi:hypothetical protein
MPATVVNKLFSRAAACAFAVIGSTAPSIAAAPPTPVAPAPAASGDAAATSGAPAVMADAPVPAPAPKSEGPRANWHPRYSAEIEVHATIAGLNDFGPGVGGGARVTIPLWSHAPFSAIDDDISAGIGLDIVHFFGFQPDEHDPRSPTVRVDAYYVPVFVEWSVWLGGRANLYLEPTLLYRFGGYTDHCDKPPAQCTPITKVIPTGSIGIRLRVADHFAVNVRVGYPMVNLGVSWL